jgi:diguanylate cyclase (GGDEF)-like protein
LASILEKDDHKRYALFFIDADNFKYINDSMGHYFGDLLIAKLGKRLGSLGAENANMYRLGGDEFIILLEECESLDEIGRQADNIIKAAEQPYNIAGITVNTTVSVGVAIYPDAVADKHELMKAADIAMYRAKEEGKDKYVYYNKAMEAAVIERMNIEKNLRTALERNEFTLNYQPQVDIATRRIVGFEALLRWNSPELGFVSPLKFIKVAEDIQIINPLGIWVLENACRFLRELQQQGYLDYKMSVNISVVQVMKDDFVDRVMQTIHSFEIDPKYIELEITETVLAESFDTICEKLDLLRQNGVGIALDDFGKGYSSLNYLNRLPITTLKIDKVFIDHIEKEKSSKSLVRMIVMVGKEMGLSMVAEGVETKEQLEYLEEIDCDNIQGYLFYKPVSEEQAIRIIKDEVLLTEDR